MSALRATGTGWQEPTDYRDEIGPFAPDGGPATGRVRSGRYAGRHSLWTAGQVHMLAGGRATHLTQEAQDYAASIRATAEREAAAITQQATGQAQAVRDAAEREAATIRQAAEREAAAITQQATGQAQAVREAAERETAELRARLDSMSSELGRLSAYVTERLAAPPMRATAPALPEAAPAPPATRPALPDSRPTRPDSRPARPAKPSTAPTRKPQQPGRQKQAARIATVATAALCLIAVGTGATEIGMHGFPFFVFRQGGIGQTAGNETDHQFLAREATTHHAVAPKGRHHRKPRQTLEVHHK